MRKRANCSSIIFVILDGCLMAFLEGKQAPGKNLGEAVVLSREAALLCMPSAVLRSLVYTSPNSAPPFSRWPQRYGRNQCSRSRLVWYLRMPRRSQKASVGMTTSALPRAGVVSVFFALAVLSDDGRDTRCSGSWPWRVLRNERGRQLRRSL